MYDTVNMALYREDCSEANFIDSVPQYLDKIIFDGTKESVVFMSGYLGSLKVNISENKVEIKKGSICKYYKGNNYYALSREDTQRIIEKISDTLHLPFQKANVTRIDFGHNFLMDNEVKLYYPYLGEKGRYQRLEQNNGLYFTTNKINLVFYDKNREQKAKKKSIPEEFKDQNVLRYELRFMKRLREQFNRPKISGELLYDEGFYRELIKRWEYHYLEIQKISNMLVSLEPTGRLKPFFDNLALLYILEIGQSKVLGTITEWQKLAYIDRKEASRLRMAVKDLTKTPITKNGNELINELNSQVKLFAGQSELPF